ncbi:hypothetical protein NKG05_15170 [Oerskovia sp. M15]
MALRIAMNVTRRGELGAAPAAPTSALAPMPSSGRPEALHRPSLPRRPPTSYASRRPGSTSSRWGLRFSPPAGPDPPDGPAHRPRRGEARRGRGRGASSSARPSSAHRRSAPTSRPPTRAGSRCRPTRRTSCCNRSRRRRLRRRTPRTCPTGPRCAAATG